MIRLVILRTLESYFRHRWLYLMPIFIMLVLGVVYVSMQEPMYISSGVVRVQEESLLSSLTSIREGDLAWVTPAEAMVDELADLLRTDAFVRAIIRETPLESKMSGGQAAVYDTIEEARQAVWATPFGNNQVSLHGGHTDPTVAYQMVNATIEGYIQWQINSDQQDSASTQAFFAELKGFNRAQLDEAQLKLEEYLDTNPMPLRGDRPEREKSQIERLQTDIDIAEGQYREVLAKEQEARLAMVQAESDARQTYFLIDAPNLPTEPTVSIRQIVMDVATFGVLGVILSAVAVAGGALLDRSLRFPIDVEHGLELPVLAMVPREAASDSKKQEPARRAAKEKRSTQSGNVSGRSGEVVIGD